METAQEAELTNSETTQGEDWEDVYEEFHKYVDVSFQSGIGANISTMCRKSDELYDKVFRNHISVLDTTLINSTDSSSGSQILTSVSGKNNMKRLSRHCVVKLDT